MILKLSAINDKTRRIIFIYYNAIILNHYIIIKIFMINCLSRYI